MTEVQVSLEGVSLKTSLHGTLLLAMGAAFYLMYLYFVFPVRAFESSTPPPTLREAFLIDSDIGEPEFSPAPLAPSEVPLLPEPLEEDGEDVPPADNGNDIDTLFPNDA